MKKIYLVFPAVFFLIFSGIIYYTSTQTVSIEPINSTAYVFEKKDFVEKNLKKNKPITSQKKLRLKRGDYVVGYEGKPGYSSGSIELTLGGDPETIVVDPYLSANALSEKAQVEQPKIEKVLRESLKGLENYRVGDLTLYHFGEWASVVLAYTGNDSFSADNLRIVLKNDGSNWSIVGGPNIFLDKNDSDGIPEDISKTTNLIFVEMDRRFVSEQERDVKQNTEAD